MTKQSSTLARLLLLLALWCDPTYGQNDCALSFWLFPSQQDCRLRSGDPSAIETFVADDVCRVMSNPSPFLLGRYTASCVSSDTVRISQSGCTRSDCSSTSGGSVCDRDLTSVSSFYSLLSTPEYNVQDPATQSGTYQCFTLRGDSEAVTFAIFGDCGACLGDGGEPMESSPSLAPVVMPVVMPTNPPTPTGQASVAPVGMPTPRPTAVPVANPVSAPINTPSSSPVGTMPDPTMAPFGMTPRPTASPVASPTRAPTFAETEEPTEDDTPVGMSIPPTGTTLPPTGSTPPPSVGGMNTSAPPTSSVSIPDTPTEIPNMTVSTPPVATTPTPVPTPQGTSSDLVGLVMLLTTTNGVLGESSTIAWESATAAHITNTLVREAPLSKATVEVDVVSQTRMSPNSSLNGVRRVQEVDELRPLRVAFDVVVRFLATTSAPNDAEAATLLGEAFNSQEDRELYINRLRATDNTAFGSLDRIQVLVDGFTPEEEGFQASSDSGGSSMGIIIGAAVGGIAILVIAALAAFFVFRNRDNQNDRVNKRLSDDDEHMQNDARELYSPPTESASPLGAANEISVDRQDDVSTLGDSILAGMAVLQDGEDERTASIDGGYDYAQEQFRGDGPLSVSRGENSTMLSSYPSVGQMGGPSLIEDDASFEELYGDVDDTSHPDRFEVDVPPGKLGMVVDTPNYGIPQVHAIKEDSVLVGRVKVGDRLMHVDLIDVTRMSAIEVSNLIHKKSKSARVLGFARKASPSNDPYALS